MYLKNWKKLYPWKNNMHIPRPPPGVILIIWDNFSSLGIQIEKSYSLFQKYSLLERSSSLNHFVCLSVSKSVLKKFNLQFIHLTVILCHMTSLNLNDKLKVVNFNHYVITMFTKSFLLTSINYFCSSTALLLTIRPCYFNKWLF